jgi:hypothetical protein
MRSPVESQIIPGIAVDSANQKFGPCQRRRAGQLGETQLHLNSGVTVQRDFQHSADSIRLTQLREECLRGTQALRFVR